MDLSTDAVDSRVMTSTDPCAEVQRLGESTVVDDRDDRFTRRELATLFVLCGALFLDALDVSMIGVSLASIQGDLHMSTSTLQWVVSAYTLGYAGFLLVGGQAADSFGRRRMFLASLSVFTLASGLGGIATTGGLLIASRLVTGVSAAFTAPAGMSIITTTFAGHKRNRALTIYSATGASGFSLGLVAGGALTDVQWRLVFLAPVAIAAFVLAAAWHLVPRPSADERRRRISASGALFVTAAMGSAVYAIVEAPADGWLSAITMSRFAVAGALGAAFIVITSRSPQPLLRLGLFRERGVAAANIGGFALLGGWVSTLFVLTLYLQQVRGYSPLATGLAVAPSGLVVAVLSPRLAPPLVARFGAIPVAAAGLIAVAAAYALLLRINIASGYVVVILPSVLLVGFAFALAYGSLSIAATAVSAGEQGVAAGVINTSFQIGPTVMIAVVTAIISSRLPHLLNLSRTTASYRAGLIAPLIAAVLGAVVLLIHVVRSRGNSATRHLPQLQ